MPTLALLLVACFGAAERGAAEIPNRAPGKAPPGKAPMQDRPAMGEEVDLSKVDPLEGVEVELKGGVGENEPACTIVALHALGAAPRSALMQFQGYDGKARVVAPRAPKPMMRGWAWVVNIRAKAEKLPAELTETADWFAKGLVAMKARWPVEGRVVLTGFSEGAMMTYAVTVRHPELVKAAVPVSGKLDTALWPDAQAPANAPPVRAFHGKIDPTVPVAEDEDLVKHLATKGWDARITVFPEMEHHLPPTRRDEYYGALKEACGR